MQTVRKEFHSPSTNKWMPENFGFAYNRPTESYETYTCTIQIWRWPTVFSFETWHTIEICVEVKTKLHPDLIIFFVLMFYKRNWFFLFYFYQLNGLLPLIWIDQHKARQKMCSALTAWWKKNCQRWRLQGNYRHSVGRLTCCWQKRPALGIDCLIPGEMLWLFKYHM